MENTQQSAVETTLARLGLSDDQKETVRKLMAKEKAGKGRRLSAEAIEAKWDHVVKGSVRWNPTANKQQATIVCTHTGCDKRRDVFTSDLFQVKVCLEHRAAAKKAKKEADKALFEAFKAAQAAETPEATEADGEATASEE